MNWTNLKPELLKYLSQHHVVLTRMAMASL